MFLLDRVFSSSIIIFGSYVSLCLLEQPMIWTILEHVVFVSSCFNYVLSCKKIFVVEHVNFRDVTLIKKKKRGQISEIKVVNICVAEALATLEG